MYEHIKGKSITVKEAAQRCGKNQETIRRWVWSGKLPAEKLGNQLFIKETALMPYITDLSAGTNVNVAKIEVFNKRAGDFRGKLIARGMKTMDSAELVREMREELNTKLEASNQGIPEDEIGRVTDFLKRTRVFRDKLRNRIGNIDTENLVRETREEYEREADGLH